MPKTNITSPTISAQLKTGMIAAGNYPLSVDLQTFYDAGNKIWCIIGTAETGQIRCVGDTPDLFDLFEQNDPDMTRAWSMGELTNWFVGNYLYDNYVETQQGANTTISFDVSGLSFSGTDNIRVNALAEEILDLLNSAVAISAQKRFAKVGQSQKILSTPKKKKSIFKR